MSPREDAARLQDIQEAIAAIKGYAAVLAGDDRELAVMAIDAVKYHFVVIGEAAASIDSALSDEHQTFRGRRSKGCATSSRTSTFT